MNQFYERREILDFRDLIKQSVGIYGNKEAFLIKGIMGEYSGITYKEFYNDIESIGTAFINMTLKSEKILIIAKNSYEWCVAYFAIINGVGSVVTLDADAPCEEIKRVVKENYIRAIIFSDEIKEKVMNLSPDLNEIKYYISIEEDSNKEDIMSFKDLLKRGYDLLKIGDTKFKNSHIDYNEVSILSYKKGESAPAIFDSRKISHALYLLASSLDINDKDIVFSDIKMCHQPDFFISVVLSLYMGLTYNFRTGELLQDIRDAKPTIIIGDILFYKEIYKNFFIEVERNNKRARVRSILSISNIFGRLNNKIRNRCLEEILTSVGCSNLKFAICTEEMNNTKLIEALINLGIKLIHGYGIEGVLPLVFINKTFSRKNSIGKPIKGVEAKISSEGNLLIKIDDLAKSDTKEEFFETGRRVVIDKQGFYYLTDKKS